MCTTGVRHFDDGTYALFKNKDFGRVHLDDRIRLDADVFGVLGMTTWAGDDPAHDQYSGLSIGANRHGLLCCDSNVVTLPGHVNYDEMTEVALTEGTDVASAAEAVAAACRRSPVSWGNLVLIDATSAASVEIRGDTALVVPLDGPTARSNHHVHLGDHDLQQDTATTGLRMAAAQRRLSAATGLREIFELQRAHDDGDTGICNHSDLNTVYSYVLHRDATTTTLHVVQGSPCSGAPRVQLEIPFGDRYRPSAVAEFMGRYPSADPEPLAHLDTPRR
jgi:hypothetical protein